MSPVRKRPVKSSPTPPERDVTDKQDPGHTEADFLRDLAKVSRNDAKQRLERSSAPAPASPKT